MCGIAGIAGQFDRDQLGSAVQIMTDALTHRGPDDQGMWVGDGFGFGMRRLSIIDLTGGHQPMWDHPSALGVVYNGEVYNYKSVRAGLEQAGVRFRTTSDTEVVLHSLARQGPDAVRDWNGMFAVAAWNDREKKLLLIRDRIGVKPLYYYWDGSLFLFASEIKALLASRLFRRRLNRQAVWDYLTYHNVPGPETMWEHVRKLPPGHMLEWSARGGDPRLRRYWTTDVLSGDEPVDIQHKTKEFETLFLDAVSLRLLASDVPVGVTLSGGLDSSAIAAAAVELGHKQFHTFSVAFADGGKYSELPYARKVADYFGLPNHEVVIDQRAFLELLPEAVRACDEPLADLTIVPLLALMRLARGYVKVALSGEGSDEILAGYELHHDLRKFEAIRRIQRLPAPLISLGARALGLVSSSTARKLHQVAATPWSRWNVVRNNYVCLNWREADKASLWPNFTGADSFAILRSMYSDARSRHPLEQLLSVMQKSWLVEDLLMKADKMSMAASLELRVPFLDYRLVEWANRQPLAVKIGEFQGRTVTKRVLREFARKRLPREILDRPKRGFPVPVLRWLADEPFARWTAEFLGGVEARLPRLFRAEEVQLHIRRASAGDEVFANRVWLLIVLEAWLRAFDVDSVAEVTEEPEGALLAG